MNISKIIQPICLNRNLQEEDNLLNQFNLTNNIVSYQEELRIRNTNQNLDSINYSDCIIFIYQTFLRMEPNEQLQYMDIGQPVGLPISEKSKNRLYLSWRNKKGQDCKMIGPETKCFCNHKFKDHNYLNPNGKKAPCTTAKCKCKTFDYIPSHGAYDFKCLCKHSFKEHDCISRKCTKPNCEQCNGFASAWTCSCGSKFIEHETVVETFNQRKQSGKNVNDMARLSEQLNHLTEEGSLLRPIKMDPVSRARLKKFDNNPYLNSIQNTIQQQEQEVQEYIITQQNKNTRNTSKISQGYDFS